MKPLLMTLISFFLGAKADHAVSDSTAGIIDMVKENIRDELSGIIFRILVGLVIAVATIFAILQFGRALQIIFNQYQYGIYFEVLTFGIVSAGGFYLLYLMFRPAPRIVIQSSPVEGVDLQGLLSRFSQGLLKGYMSGPNSTTNRSLEADF